MEYYQSWYQKWDWDGILPNMVSEVGLDGILPNMVPEVG